MADFTFTQSDTRPFLAVIIKNSLTNAVVDLTGATVTFSMRHQKAKATETPVVNGQSVNVTSAAAGECEYRWGASDLNIPGLYRGEFLVTHTDSKVQSVPIDEIEVLPKVRA